MRFRRSRRVRPRTRWLEGISQTMSSAGKYTVFEIANQSTVPAGPLTDLISRGQIQDVLDGRGTLMRLVGQLHVNLDPGCYQQVVASAPGAPVIVWLGIKASEEPPAGTQATWDPSDAQAQEGSWMWTKTVALNMPSWGVFVPQETSYYAPTTTCCPTKTIEVDIRTKRKLTNNMSVSLYGCGALANYAGIPYGDTVSGVHVVANLVGNIRALCKLS